MRAPVRGILFFGEMLLKDRVSDFDATSQDYLSRITDAASLMNTLIENLLEYSRLSKANLPLKAVSLNLIVARSIAQLETQIAQTQARITVVEPMPSVLAHPPTLLQVLANLLSNAPPVCAAGDRAAGAILC
ncbi:hypothetical protein QUB05_06400 [Microcoleus sp. F10-C6]|uniref:histidine kinase dimerization/phospho-acceptor domain-containing protein n=1 Tax=unclassified Microcoleus TaxID=2642155 RepID=UPI002FCF6E28